MNFNPEIKEDLERARKALKSAQRNFEEEDILTAANRLFVACESAVYALLKLEHGSISMSRERILTRLKDFDPQMKDIYDQSYDLRVQADYGKESKQLLLNQENVRILLANITQIIQKVESSIKSRTNK